MFIVTIILKSTPQLLQFNFDTLDNALTHYSSYDELSSQFAISDDYGSSAIVKTGEIAGVFMTDLDREMEAAEKNEMSKIKKDINIRKKLQQDPAARILMPAQGQPS